MACNKGQFDVVKILFHKMITKSNFRNLKLKSHEEYLIYRTYFIQQKT